MKLKFFLLPVPLIICLSFSMSMAQKRGVLDRKRSQIDLSNYYISLNLNYSLTQSTGLIEWKIDSLRAIQQDQEIRNNLILLKYKLTSVLSKTAFNADPLVGGLDTWALTYQLIDYFSTDRCRGLYGNACDVLSEGFVEYNTRIQQYFSNYITDFNQQNLEDFTKRNPILDDHLNRASIAPLLSKWVSEEELRLKTGLITMTELMRDIGEQIEYYTELVPKQTKWQMEYIMESFLSKDSVVNMMNDMHHLIATSNLILENAEDMINFSRDTVLENVNDQRIATLQMIQNERIATLEALAKEREIVLDTLQNERKALEEFASHERVVLMEDMNKISKEVMNESLLIGKDLIDYIFTKVMIATAIFGIIIIIGIIIFKRL